MPAKHHKNSGLILCKKNYLYSSLCKSITLCADETKGNHIIHFMCRNKQVGWIRPATVSTYDNFGTNKLPIHADTLYFLTAVVYKLASLRSQGWGYLTTRKEGLIVEVNAFFHKPMNRRGNVSNMVSAYNIPSFHNTEMSGKYACTAIWSHSLNLANILMNRCFYYIILTRIQ